MMENFRIYWETMLLAQEFERDLQTLEVLVEAIKTGTVTRSAAEAEESFKKRNNKTISASRRKLSHHLDLDNSLLQWRMAQQERNWLAHECLLDYNEGTQKSLIVSRIASARQTLETAHREVLDVAAYLIEASGGSPS